MYKKVIKPILFLFPPDFVHSSIVALGSLIQRVPFARSIIKRMWGYSNKALSQNLYGLEIKNPVGLSAGFDKNVQLVPLMESVGFGFETAGSVTLAPRKGNDKPWFYRLPKTKSLVVHAGMANQGLINIAKRIRRNRSLVKKMPLFISVAVVARSQSETIWDAIIDAKNTTLYVLQHKLATGVEINISCPNVQDNQPFAEAENLEKLLTEIDKLDRKVPFFIKMPNMANVRNFDALLKVIVRHNIQGVTISNLVKDRKQVSLEDHLPDEVPGGLSGAPTRENSLKMIRHTYNNYGDKLTIIGVGGIFTAADAYEDIRAGASLVAMITGVIFEGPGVVGQINRQLVELMRHDGFGMISEAVGADLKNLQ